MRQQQQWCWQCVYIYKPHEASNYKPTHRSSWWQTETKPLSYLLKSCWSNIKDEVINCKWLTFLLLLLETSAYVWPTAYTLLLTRGGKGRRRAGGKGLSILLAFPFSLQFDTNHLCKVWAWFLLFFNRAEIGERESLADCGSETGKVMKLCLADMLGKCQQCCLSLCERSRVGGLKQQGKGEWEWLEDVKK